MSQLDDALKAFLQEPGGQDAYYRLVLESDFYIPLQPEDSEIPLGERDAVRPLVAEADGKHYLLLFDSEERLDDWAKQPTEYVILSGQGAADHTPPELHWAINVGSKFAKELLPEEIGHLRDLAKSGPD